MVDYSKLNKHVWCKCCTPEQMFLAAEEMIDDAMRKHYTKPMCAISMGHVAQIAAFMAGGAMSSVVARIMSADTGLPKEVTGAFAQDHMLAAETAILENVAEFLTHEYPNFINQLIAKMNAIKEIKMADEAFNADQKPT